MSIVQIIWFIISITGIVSVSIFCDIKHYNYHLTFMILCILLVTVPYLICVYLKSKDNHNKRISFPKFLGTLLTIGIFVFMIYLTAKIVSLTSDMSVEQEKTSEDILLYSWISSLLFCSIMMSVNFGKKKRKITTIIY